MGSRVSALIISLSGLILFVLAERPVLSAENDALQEALNVMNQVPTGQDLLQKAKNLWHISDPLELVSHFKWGYASRTDTILTRHYNPKTGKEDRQREITIFLREDQTQIELTLDMAHELVHATSRPSFDPYDPTLTAGKYISAAIEGSGGEVEAVLVECKIGVELSKRFKIPFSRCNSYRKRSISKIEFDREKVRQEFYRVGQWKPELLLKLKDEIQRFPALSEEPPKLYSSTGHAPYPLALLREFEEITEMACDNSRIRMRSVAQRSAFFQISSPRHVQLQSAPQDDVQHFILKRCN